MAALVLLAGLAIGSGRAAAGPEYAQPRANVVVVMTDDQTLEALGAMPRTRGLIGEAGATFTNFFVTFPLCCPSRASFLTGQYAHNHRVLENFPPRGGYQSLAADETLPVWLSRAGYVTAQVGKFMNGYDTSGVGIPPGWGEWHGMKTENRYYGYDLFEGTATAGGGTVTYGDFSENPDDPAAPETYSSDIFTAKAVDFIAAHAPSPDPFFLWVSYNAPHSGQPEPPPDPPSRCRGNAKPAERHLGAFATAPLPTPPSFNEPDLSDKPPSVRSAQPFDAGDVAAVEAIYRCERESLLAVDEGVERIVAALAASGELANTYVAFTSDNGFFHGEHRITFGKNRFYEEAIRVPLLVRGPGIPRGTEVEELAANVDLAPTFLDIARARAGVPQDGRSLLPLIEHPERLRGREIMIDTNTYKAVRTSRYAYAEHFARADKGSKELYDLERDPFQLLSRHDDEAYAEVRRALAERLDRLRFCDGAECREAPRLKLRRAGAESCSPRFVAAIIRGRDAEDLRKAEFRLRGRSLRTDRAAPFEVTLPLRRLQRAGSRLEVEAEFVDGRRMTLAREIRCR